MKFAVVGTGGVGGYFGGRLAEAGQDVHFIARGAHLAAMREKGLRVDSIEGDFVVDPVQATSDPAEIGPVDVVIVAVKTWQLEEAARSLAPLLHQGTIVLPLLNGVEAVDILSEAVGRPRVLGGVCRISARIEAPGHIVHSAIEPSITFGEQNDGRTARVESLLAAFTEARIRATVAENIAVAIWEKFALIATWSGIGSVTRVPIGEWRTVPEVRRMAEACLREIVAVAHAREVPLEKRRTMSVMDTFDSVPPDSQASMQRDVLAGRPSELEAQNGAVVRLGAAAEVPTPAHSFLYAALLPQERAARALG